MNPLLLALIWLAAGSGFALVTGKGIAHGQRRDRQPVAVEVTSPKAAVSRTYVRLDLADIALAAHSAATQDLLSTRPGAIRQVPAR